MKSRLKPLPQKWFDLLVWGFFRLAELAIVVGHDFLVLVRNLVRCIGPHTHVVHASGFCERQLELFDQRQGEPGFFFE